MKINHILLDIDGVLGDFYGQAFRAFNKPMPKTQAEWPERGRKLIEACELESWHHLHTVIPGFWSEMPLLPGAEELIELVRNHSEPAGRRFNILTSPPVYAPALSDRMQWLNRLKFDGAIYCREKDLFAKPGRLLIDDTPQNCDAWQKAGGTAFLWRQPWNTPCTGQPNPENEWDNPWVWENLRMLEDLLKADA
jgi:5' nucleotidase, deoxy (Pyrimidine), cytosolic type C protein (NT5C)